VARVVVVLEMQQEGVEIFLQFSLLKEILVELVVVVLDQ
jgi:hypothetical protein